jgi:hypothetical protein
MVVVNSFIFWDTMPRSSACHLLSQWFLAQLTLWPWRWRQCVSLKRQLTYNGLHGIISQKTKLITWLNYKSWAGTTQLE